MTPLQLQQTMESTLATAFPTTFIAWENVSSTAPVDAVYLRPELRPVDDYRNTLGTGDFIKHRGVFFVYVVDPNEAGVSPSITKAQEVATIFTATSIDIGHGAVHVDVPKIQRLGRLASGYNVAVSIGYWYYSGAV